MINCKENENDNEKWIIKLIDLDLDMNTIYKILDVSVRWCLYVISNT